MFRGTARIRAESPVSHPGAPCSLSPQLQMPNIGYSFFSCPGAPCSLSPQLQMPNIGYSFFSWILEGTEYLWMGKCGELQPDGYIWIGTDGKLQPEYSIGSHSWAASSRQRKFQSASGRKNEKCRLLFCSRTTSAIVMKSKTTNGLIPLAFGTLSTSEKNMSKLKLL